MSRIMKTYQIPVTDIQLLTGERMMDPIGFSYRPEGGNPEIEAMMYSPQSPKVR